MKNNYLRLFLLQKNSTGFTLVELLVAMALTSIFIAAAGYGLVSISSANQKAKAETERRVDLNRAQDFIADEVRTAIKVDDSSPAPAWAWTDLGSTMGGVAPDAKLYLQIPFQAVGSTNASGSSEITINNHGLPNGTAVMFVGSGTAPGLTRKQRYYVINTATNTFNVSNTPGGTAQPITGNISGGSLNLHRHITFAKTLTPG
jgi:prepilin-type N-terminal cleavage/methylation domain-containing protein